MKYTWQPNDIRGGIFVCKDIKHIPGQKFDYNVIHSTYMIGWQVEQDHSGCTYYNIISLIDGRITGSKTAEEMCTILNKDKLIPAPVDWLLRLVNEFCSGRDRYLEFK